MIAPYGSASELIDLYDNAPCGYHSLDGEGRFLRVNATEIGWLGCEREALIGRRRITDFFTAEGRMQFAHWFPRLKAEGRVEGLEFELVGAQGRRRRVSLSASAVCDAEGRYVASRTVMFDISELHRARGELQAMLDTDLVGIVRLRERRIVWANRGMERTFGHGADMLVGRSTRLLHVDDEGFEREGALAQAALRQGGDYRQQLQMRRADGSLVWIDARGTRLSAADGESLWLLADITPIKQAEAMRLKAASLQAENRRLHEEHRVRTLFLANMSHELRTPLNAVIGCADLLKVTATGGEHAKFGEFVAQIGAGGRTLLGLIQNLLDHVDAESGRIALQPARFELAAVVHEVVDLQRSAAAQKRQRLEVVVEPDLGSVQLDALRLRQVLLNYLSNAIKFTPDGGFVGVNVLAQGTAHFRLEVVDSGVGIAAADLPRLFTPFSPLACGEARPQPGAGLGLAITKRLVELQGGSVGVHSEPGVGSCFHAVLPRTLVAA